MHLYIRVNKTPNSPRKSIQIVESIRQGNKVRQKIVHYVGIALDDREEQKLKDYATELIAKITAPREEESKQKSLFSLCEADVLNHVKNRAERPKKRELKRVCVVTPLEVSLLANKNNH